MCISQFRAHWIFTKWHPFKHHPDEKTEYHLYPRRPTFASSQSLLPPQSLSWLLIPWVGFVLLWTWYKWKCRLMCLAAFLLVSCSVLFMLLHVTVVHALSLLWCSLLYEILSFIHSTVNGHWDCFLFGTSTNTVAVNILEHIFVVYLYIFLLGISLGLESWITWYAYV